VRVFALGQEWGDHHAIVIPASYRAKFSLHNRGGLADLDPPTPTAGAPGEVACSFRVLRPPAPLGVWGSIVLKKIFMFEIGILFIWKIF
jgi:hypothetical protein